MDGNLPPDKSSAAEISISKMELPSIMEQNLENFVPKIRIRLRPNSEQLNVHCQSTVYGTLADKSESTIIRTKVIKNDYINENSETKCYKILEDSGGGGHVSDADTKSRHHYMIHGINLRARIPKPMNISKKKKTNERKNNVDKGQKDNKPVINSIVTKNPFKSYILNSSKNHRRKEKNDSKSFSKVRNEILGSINLKDIVNHENFLKLSPEMQWQLANLLPNCDKPKSSDTRSSCHCSDLFSTTNEHQRVNPSVNFNALNNEFLAKALTKYSQKVGQSDLINLLTSERENLRSRPIALINEEISLIESKECEVKKEESNNNIDEDEDMKLPDDIKSNSSVCTTETMEMNGTGNLFENISLKMEQFINTEAKYTKSCDINYFTDSRCEDISEGCLVNDSDAAPNSQCDRVNDTEVKEDHIEGKNSPMTNNHHLVDPEREECSDYKNLTLHLSIDTNNVYNESNTSDTFDDVRMKRGRKRKILSISDDILTVPVKRSNRSTAGKRPARLDSESPPISPNHNPNVDKKSHHNKFKKQKERNRINKKSKTKLDHSSDEFECISKMEAKSKKHLLSHDIVKYPKNCPSSPESLPTESDLSPLSKPSPNGSSLLSNFCRSSLASFYNDKRASNHVSSVQALSPSWSCTSESTTPSVKSDYGHVQSTKTSPTPCNTNSTHTELKTSAEQDTNLIQGMPPPRQTLTLAAMREKMRAKKLAKEDNRKDTTSNWNNVKNKRLNQEPSLLKEGEDDLQLMDKMMSSSEEYDELLNNSQDSLLDFFMSDDNYDFEATSDHCSDISTCSQKPINPKKSIPKIKSSSQESLGTVEAPSNCRRSHPKSGISKYSSSIVNRSAVNTATSESDKTIADTIATVLQKLNTSKENGLVVSSSATKTSVPNAYLVDGNGLSTALSIIQSLNPGAKVTTQQFYLVNSGPQLILQPSPPTNMSEKLTSLAGSVGLQHKVSLAPKLANQATMARALSLSSSCSLESYTPDSLTKTTYMMSPMAHGVSMNQTAGLHLQTISSPHQIGLVHSMHQQHQQLANQAAAHAQLGPSPPLFSQRLRFLHPGQSAPGPPLSLMGPSAQARHSPVANHSQSPKLLFLCPAVASAPGLTAGPNVLNQDQKYLLLSKQPDKQATIQLVSSQGLWQQLNPNLISQPNNLLLVQPQPLSTLDSLLCPGGGHMALDCLPEKQYLSGADTPTASLIIDSRSLISSRPFGEEAPATPLATALSLSSTPLSSFLSSSLSIPLAAPLSSLSTSLAAPLSSSLSSPLASQHGPYQGLYCLEENKIGSVLSSLNAEAGINQLSQDIGQS